MSLTKIYNFDDGADYTFDSDLVEVSSGTAKQKKQVYADETFYADFSETVNGRRGLGDLTTVNHGSPTIDDSRLNLKGNVDKWVGIPPVGNYPDSQEGTWEFTFIPNFDNAPAGNQYIMSSRNRLADSHSRMYLRYNNVKLLYVEVRDENNSVLASMIFGSLTAVKGQKYRFSLNYNFNSGAGNGFVRLFIDGDQVGIDASAVGTVGVINHFYVGSANVNDPPVSNDFEMENLQIFSTVQRTANYTPDYDTANFLTYNNQNPSILQTEGLDSKSLDAYSGTVVEPAGTSVGSIMNVNTFDMYFNGLAWVTSTSYINSNSIAIVESSKSLLDLSDGKILCPKWYLIGDGWSTPEIDLITLSYSYFNSLEILNRCLVSGEFTDQNGNPDTEAIVLVSSLGFYHGDTYISTKKKEYTANDRGIIEFSLVETATVSKTMIIEIISDKSKLKKSVIIPNQEQEDLSNLMS